MRLGRTYGNQTGWDGDEPDAMRSGMTGGNMQSRYSTLEDGLRKEYNQGGERIQGWQDQYNQQGRAQASQNVRQATQEMVSGQNRGGFNPAGSMNAQYAGGQLRGEADANNKVAAQQASLQAAMANYGNTGMYQGAQGQMRGMEYDSYNQMMNARMQEQMYQDRKSMEEQEGTMNTISQIAGAGAGLIGGIF